jgi:NADP-dependent 3-hydroxy acid dehydrogenase YdfG
MIVPMDACQWDQVTRGLRTVEEAWNAVAHVVFAAGTNLGKERRWSALSGQSFAALSAANTGGLVNVLVAALPQMRSRGGGRVFVIGSWGGWRRISVAGGPYCATKAALGPLVESLNEEEGRAGIRATLVQPGPVDTEIVNSRPSPPSSKDRERYLRPDDIAQLIEMVLSLPFRVCVNEIVVSPVINELYLRESAYDAPIIIDPTGASGEVAPDGLESSREDAAHPSDNWSATGQREDRWGTATMPISSTLSDPDAWPSGDRP